MKKFIIVYTTSPTKDKAEKITKILVKEKLAACCNIFKVDSIFRWQGKIEKSKEYGIFIKTKGSLFKKVKRRIKEIHPYSVPCIVSLPVENGYKKFLEWIDESTI